MKKVELMSGWELREVSKEEWLSCDLPATVYSTLLNHNRMVDPFYRDNEYQVRDLCDKDYEFRKKFSISKEILALEHVRLSCEGIDTVADIYINNVLCGKAYNMHRQWEYDVKKFLVEGENEVKIYIYSPNQYIAEKDSELYLWGAGDGIDETSMRGFPHIRKAHCMFGWDWGPQLPDMGIFRKVELLAFNQARLDEVYISQKHKGGKVELKIDVSAKDVSVDNLKAEIAIIHPEGYENIIDMELNEGKGQCEVAVQNPKLWWPNGYGEQNLYTVRVKLRYHNEEIDYKKYRIGLRTLKVSRQPDKWGEEFCLVVNGIKIFSMGADYIPEDNILPRINKDRTNKLLKSCKIANHNTIRVWGGGYYPDDYFYDLCDEYGLIIWQDFMFACAVYDLNEEFKNNIIEEIKDNIKRIRHHASLGLWCGNNEMEMGWIAWEFPKSEKFRLDYLEQFEVVIKQLCKKHDPETFYWPASPSSGGGFVTPNDENRGDVHYWDVWHGNKPFEDYRNYYFRFCSEFGFEAFPHIETLKTIGEERDMNLLSYVMEQHQKCKIGNSKILNYLSDNYRYPKDFEHMVYASQLLQADAIRYGVEHFRRHRGRCMGAIYWQLNDCWPAPSWSSIDYLGRWKALHYASKRFFSPVMISAHEDELKVILNLSNETLQDRAGTIRWTLKDNRNNMITTGEVVAQISRLSAKDCLTIDLEGYINDISEKRSRYLEFGYYEQGNQVSGSTMLFIKPKHFEFEKPEYKVEVIEEKESYKCELDMEVYAKGIFVDIAGEKVVLENNYFDFTGESVIFNVLKKQLEHVQSKQAFLSALNIKSIYDIG